MRGATSIRSNLCSLRGNFNPRSSCEERRWRRASSRYLGYFNPRSSCEERPKVMVKNAVVKAFQSTLLMRGATGWDLLAFLLLDFNPRSSCEERQAARWRSLGLSSFKSTLLMRGATEWGKTMQITTTFQSTLLMRGATRRGICWHHAY